MSWSWGNSWGDVSWKCVFGVDFWLYPLLVPGAHRWWYEWHLQEEAAVIWNVCCQIWETVEKWGYCQLPTFFQQLITHSECQ